MQKPTVGLTVHYVSYGTPGGEYTSKCRAATVTEVSPEWLDDAPEPQHRVSLCVMNPSGLFFNQHLPYNHGGTESGRKGGTWHHVGECSGED